MATMPSVSPAIDDKRPVADKERFEGLDGMRGIAAVAVVIHHMHIVSHGYRLFDGANLAVDFFFMLSGFVIANSYERQFRGSLSFNRYVGKRFVRLLPLVWLGLVLALPLFLHHGGLDGGSPLTFMLVFAGWLLTFPMTWKGVPWALNYPHWSLFWELAVNVAYGAGLWRLSNRQTLALIVVGAVAVCSAALAQGTLALGQDWATLPFGAVRVIFPFFAGVLLSRSLAWWPILPFGWKTGGLLMIALFLLPMHVAGRAWIDIAADLLIFPLVVVGAAQHAPRSLELSVAKFSGAVSYPAYALHAPLLLLLLPLSRFVHREDFAYRPSVQLAWCVVVIGLAWVALKIYDEPVRKWLGGKRPAAELPQSAP